MLAATARRHFPPVPHAPRPPPLHLRAGDRRRGAGDGRSRARCFREHGHEVTSFAAKGAAAPGVEVLPELRRARRRRARSKRASWNCCARASPAQEAVFLHNVCTMPFHPALTAALWALAAEPPPASALICWVHDVAAANPDYAGPRDAGRPGAAAPASPHFEYVAVSALRQRQLEECLGVPRGAAAVIPNGLWPLEHLGRARRNWRRSLEQWRLLERDLVLLHPARLLRRKNVEFSLEVLAALRARGQRRRPARDGARRSPPRGLPGVRRGAAAAPRGTLGLAAHACFLSEHLALTRAGARAASTALADAVLFPSRQEGFGLPILEAALQRVPIFCPGSRAAAQHPPARADPLSHGLPAREVAALVMRQSDGSPAIRLGAKLLRGYPGAPSIEISSRPFWRKRQTSPPYP